MPGDKQKSPAKAVWKEVHEYSTWKEEYERKITSVYGLYAGLNRRFVMPILLKKVCMKPKVPTKFNHVFAW